MNQARVKCLSVLSIFALVGFGPISPTCLLGFYIVAMRPLWFFALVGNVYDNPPRFQMSDSATAGNHAILARIKCFLSLLALLILDIAPIPVTAMIAFPIVLIRPKWFKCTVLKVYGRN